MTTKLIAEALGRLDDSYVEEALAYRPARRRTWIRWSAAACFAVVCAAALLFAPSRPSQAEPPPTVLSPAVTPPASPQVTVPPSVSVPPSALPEPDALHISMSGITVNDSEPPVSAARLYYDPALYDTVPWDLDAVIEYLGRDLTPAYVPAGLDAYDGNGTAQVVIRKEDGAVVLDTVYYSYFQTFGTWEDGSPKTMDENCVQHGFTLTASKVGILNCGIVYIGPEDEVKTSDIAGVPVTIGYRSMSHGPYDPETHEPAGYYDLYVAEFTLGDVQLQLVADEMTLEDVVKVTASIIAPDQEIVLDP